MEPQPHVLIVDDEPAVADFLALTIRAMGFTADCARDGLVALDMAAKRPPCFVLLDALLPKMDGFQVLAALRKQSPDLPVVMMSGVYKKRNYEVEALDKLGAKEYLHKPLSVLQVWELVERHAPAPSRGVVPPDFPGVPFRRRPLPSVVGDLNRSKSTGLLFVRGTGGTAILFFEDGNLVFGRTNDPASRLDRVLVQMGKLLPESLARAKELVAASRGAARFGEIIVREGMITTEDLQAGLAEQQRQQVVRPFTWTEGACHFFPTDMPRAETFKLTIEMTPLLMWACRHLRDDEALEAWLPGPDRRPRLDGSALATAGNVDLSAAEREFIRLLDGTRNVAKLRAIGRMAQVDVNRLLAGLLCADLARVQDDDAVPATRSHSSSGQAVAPFGDLARQPPAMLLVAASFARTTGILRATAPGTDSPATRAVYIQDGGIAFATSNSPQDRLGQVLIRAGLATPEQVNACLEIARNQPGVALGRVLVDQHVLALDDLHAALVAQASAVIEGLVRWRTGTFEFQEGPLPSREIVPLGLDTLDVILRAIRACPFGELAGLLPSNETYLQPSWNQEEIASRLALSDVERDVLGAAGESIRIREVLARASQPPEDVLRSIHALLSVGALEGSAAPRSAASGRAADAAPASRVGDIEEFGSDEESGGETSVSDEGDGGEMSFGSLEDTPAPEAIDPPAPALKLDAVPGGGLLSSGWALPGLPTPASTVPTPTAPAFLAPEPPSFSAPAVTLDDPASLPDLSDEDFEGVLSGRFAQVDSTFGEAAPSVDAATAVATLEPGVASCDGNLLEADELGSVSAFLGLLAVHLATSPRAVPESLLAVLPPSVRRRFGL